MKYASPKPSSASPGHWTNGHAVVVGASMAGLVAASVLSDRFQRVTVIDRDVLPSELAGRNGAPQGRHGHGLLASGFAALEALLFVWIRDGLVLNVVMLLHPVEAIRAWQLRGIPPAR